MTSARTSTAIISVMKMSKSFTKNSVLHIKYSNLYYYDITLKQKIKNKRLNRETNKQKECKFQVEFKAHSGPKI